MSETELLRRLNDRYWQQPAALTLVRRLASMECRDERGNPNALLMDHQDSCALEALIREARDIVGNPSIG